MATFSSITEIAIFDLVLPLGGSSCTSPEHFVTLFNLLLHKQRKMLKTRDIDENVDAQLGLRMDSETVHYNFGSNRLRSMIFCY